MRKFSFWRRGECGAVDDQDDVVVVAFNGLCCCCCWMCVEEDVVVVVVVAVLDSNTRQTNNTSFTGFLICFGFGFDLRKSNKNVWKKVCNLISVCSERILSKYVCYLVYMQLQL